MDKSTQDILEKIVGYGILALLIIGFGWPVWITLFSLIYILTH